MNRKEYKLLVIFILTFSLSAQEGKAVYGKEIMYLNDDNRSGSESAYTKQALENLKTFEYELTFNKNVAHYEKQSALAIKPNPLIDAMTNAYAGFFGISYFDNTRNLRVQVKEFSGETYAIKMNKVDWVLSKETRKIDQYICYKATTTETREFRGKSHLLTIVAWYAPELSLPFGPDGYGELPGLIVQLEKNGTRTSLKKIEFKKQAANKIIEPPIEELITEEEYRQITNAAYKQRL